MRKLLHRFLILFTVSFLGFYANFGYLAIAQNENQIQDIKQNGEMNLVQNEIKVDDLNTSPIDTKQLGNVVPDTKKEGRKVINLFIKVMSAVLVSALILYLVLRTVKKYYGSAFAVEEQEDLENLNLNSPSDKEEALKSFLNRTK